MTTQERNELAALLLKYHLEELRPVEEIATNDRDFDKLKDVYKVDAAIDIILESLKN